MQRLKERYPDATKLVVLVNQTEELLLLLNDRHTKFEKKDLSFIDNHSVKIDILNPAPADIARVVRHLFIDLYGTDIESIVEVPGGYRVTIKDSCLMYYGSFKIKYRENLVKDDING